MSILALASASSSHSLLLCRRVHPARQSAILNSRSRDSFDLSCSTMCNHERLNAALNAALADYQLDRPKSGNAGASNILPGIPQIGAFSVQLRQKENRHARNQISCSFSCCCWCATLINISAACPSPQPKDFAMRPMMEIAPLQYADYQRRAYAFDCVQRKGRLTSMIIGKIDMFSKN